MPGSLRESFTNQTDCDIPCASSGGRCCDVNTSITVQAISMGGSFIILLAIILFCYMRYRCYRRHLHNIMARRQQADQSRQTVHSQQLDGTSRPISVSAIEVSRDNLGDFLTAFSRTQSRDLFHVIVHGAAQPPPYSENDPLPLPANVRSIYWAQTARRDLPPAYADVVKENERRGENSSQLHYQQLEQQQAQLEVLSQSSGTH